MLGRTSGGVANGLPIAHARDGSLMRYVEVQPALKTQRVESVDALRGFNFVWILCGDGAMLAIGEMSRGKGPVVGAVGGFLDDSD